MSCFPKTIGRDPFLCQKHIFRIHSPVKLLTELAHMKFAYIMKRAQVKVCRSRKVLCSSASFYWPLSPGHKAGKNHRLVCTNTRSGDPSLCCIRHKPHRTNPPIRSKKIKHSKQLVARWHIKKTFKYRSNTVIRSFPPCVCVCAPTHVQIEPPPSPTRSFANTHTQSEKKGQDPAVAKDKPMRSDDRSLVKQ